MNSNDRFLKEQIRYYRERAPEYDEWFLRQGRYFLGDEQKNEWFSEIKDLDNALQESKPSGHILELACGTGIWTEKLIHHASKMTALDSSPEVIEICKKRILNREIEFINHDIFNWEPQQSYDFIFFGFWLSHVPLELFDSFWKLVQSALKPDGRVFFVDSQIAQGSSAKDHRPVDHSGIAERKLNDGQIFQIVKIFHDPEELKNRLETLGWSGYVRRSGRFFIYGCFSI